jgi:Tol biopolymer transport system component
MDSRYLAVFGLAIVLLTLPAVVAAQAKIERIAFTTDRDGNNEIYLMKPDGTELVRLTNNAAFDVDPVISPDGSRIAFTSNRDGNEEIYVMNADGTNPRRLINNSAIDREPTWNSDCSKIAFTSFRDGNTEIYSMNADGTNQINLTSSAVNESQPSFSKDGTRIVFLSDQQVWVMNADGSNKTPLTNEIALKFSPTFSPDGTKIAFRKVKDVYVMNADGTNHINLTNSETLDNEPSYSPNGSKIAFKSFRDGNFEIYSMNADGTDQQRLTNTGAVTDSRPDWGNIAGVGVDVPELSAGQNTTLIVPINVSDTNEWGILSYDFILNYNPEVVEPLAVPYDTSGSLSTNFEVNAASTPGQIVISGFGTAPLSGAGTLLNLKFRVIGAPQALSSLNLGPVTFNEGLPFSIVSSGSVRVTGVMRGAVSYATSASVSGVPGVSLSAAGSPNVSATTDSDGTYEMVGFGLGSYTATPSKQGDNGGITALDASLVSRFLVGTASLTMEQQLAGDVSGNGSLTSFDAALIAQYVAGISNAGQTGTWRFYPESRSYTSVANETAQDYIAFLMGEVSGNWAPQSASLGTNLNNTESADKQTNRRPGGGVTASLPALKAAPNQLITIPVSLTLSGTAAALEAYQFNLVYDPQVIQPDGASADTTGTLSSSLNAVVNKVEPGRLRLVVYGSNAVSISGTLINLRFRVVGRPGSVSTLAFDSLIFNEGSPAVEGKNGKVTVQR